MDPIEYYITTLVNAFKNIAPIAAFIIGGYFIFIKGPFLLLKRSMSEQKKKLEEEEGTTRKEEKYSVENYLEFQRKLKLMNGEKTQEELRKENVGSDTKTGQQKKPEQKSSREQQDPDQKASGQKKSEQKKSEQKKPASEKPLSQSPEDIFGLKNGEKITQAELKKRYFQLLKENHPDRVASLGPDFKKLAEKNTKDINHAFDILKKKAS